MRGLTELEIGVVSGGKGKKPVTGGKPGGTLPKKQQTTNQIMQTTIEMGGHCHSGAIVVKSSGGSSSTTYGGSAEVDVVGVAGSVAGRGEAEVGGNHSQSSGGETTTVYCGNPQTGEFYSPVEFGTDHYGHD